MSSEPIALPKSVRTYSRRKPTADDDNGNPAPPPLDDLYGPSSSSSSSPPTRVIDFPGLPSTSTSGSAGAAFSSPSSSTSLLGSASDILSRFTKKSTSFLGSIPDIGKSQTQMQDAMIQRKGTGQYLKKGSSSLTALGRSNLAEVEVEGGKSCDNDDDDEEGEGENESEDAGDKTNGTEAEEDEEDDDEDEDDFNVPAGAGIKLAPSDWRKILVSDDDHDGSDNGEDAVLDPEESRRRAREAIRKAQKEEEAINARIEASAAGVNDTEGDEEEEYEARTPLQNPSTNPQAYIPQSRPLTTFDSDLTTLPSSQPPAVPSESINYFSSDPVHHIGAATSKGKKKRIFESGEHEDVSRQLNVNMDREDEEEQDQDVSQRRRGLQDSPESPTTLTMDTKKNNSKRRRVASSSPASDHINRTINVQSMFSDDEEDEGETTPRPTARKNRSARPVVSDESSDDEAPLVRLKKDIQRDDEQKRSEHQRKRGSSELARDEEIYGWKRSRGGKERPLSKKAQREMEMTTAEIRANRPRKELPKEMTELSLSGWFNETERKLGAHKPTAPVVPISSVMLRMAAAPPSSVLSPPSSMKHIPLLQHNDLTPPSTMKDDITQFSSKGKHPRGSGIQHQHSPTERPGQLRLKPASSGYIEESLTCAEDQLVPPSSSVVKPSRSKGKSNRMVTQDESESEEEPGLSDLVKQAEAEERAQQLRMFKANAASKLPPRNTNPKNEESDDDFEIIDMPQTKQDKHAALTKRAVAPLDPKKALNGRDQSKLGYGQTFAAATGISKPKHEVATESMMTAAAKSFGKGTDSVRFIAPGARNKKVKTITQSQIDADLLEKDKKMRLIAEKKKAVQTGYRARTLAPKQPTNMLKFAEQMEHAAEADEEDDENELVVDLGSDDDDEDETYQPDEVARDEDIPEEGRIDITSPQDVEDEQVVQVDELPTEEDVEMSGPEDETALPIKKRPRNKQRVSDSDDEGETTLPKRMTQIPKKRISDSDDEGKSELPIRTTQSAADLDIDEGQRATPTRSTQNAAAETSQSGFDVDFEGFDADGGFSQLFATTQAAAKTDGFGNLRHDAAEGLASTSAVLPTAGVSGSSRARNEALLLAEVLAEEDDDALQEEERPQVAQYINAKGFFTQTKQDAQLRLLRTHTSTSLDSIGSPNKAPSPDDGYEATYRSEADLTSTIENITETSISPPPVGHRDGSTQQVTPDENIFTRPSPSAMQVLGENALVRSPPKDAFSRLMDAQEKRAQQEKARRERPEHSEFLDDAAEESEDENYPFGGKGDAEEDGDDLDGVVEGLVDDQERTAEQLKADEELMREKLRKIEEEDDAKRQKIAQDAVDGKFRGRKRDGDLGDFGFDSDDEEHQSLIKRNRRAERERKRRLQGADGLDKLDEDADAFKKVYADDLTDDEDVDGLEEEADIISPLVEDECSPSPDSEIRNEFIDHHEIQIAARRKKAEQREREEEADTLDSLGYKADPVLSDTDEDEPEEESQFSISKAGSFVKKSFSDDPSKYQRQLERQGAANTDTRAKSAKNSSVSGGKQGNDRRNVLPDKYKRQNAPASLSRTGTLGSVMAKKSGFQ